MKPFPFFFALAFISICADSDIPLGSSLLPRDAPLWSSPQNSFFFGFISDPQNPSLFLAAITYNGGTPVWFAGGTAVDSGGFFSLLSDGNLVLSNGSGIAVWESGTAGRGVTGAALEESGNLKLFGRNASVLWQTFDNPTDTIVESQNLTFGKSLKSGLYSFAVSKAGSLTLIWNDSITYLNDSINSSFVSNQTLDSPSIVLESDGILFLFDEMLPNREAIAYSSNYGESGDMIRFLRLDRDGNLRAYSVLRGSSAAQDRWSAVADQCQVFGWCGNMGICHYDNLSPVCNCPSENFEPVDPKDTTKGCKRKTEIKACPGSATMLELDNTLFLTYPPELSTQQYFVGITACRLNCLSGDSCIASTSLSDGSGLCYLKVSTFVSGHQSPSLPSTSFVKVCAPAAPFSVPPAQSNRSSSRLKPWIVAVAVVGAILGLLTIEAALWLCFCRKRRQSLVQHALLEYTSAAPVQFSYKELRRSTKGFKERLGSGGFGTVYRGVLANRTAVAVKQLKGVEQGEKQFRIEVATLSSTHHLNLVRLLGFCSEGRHRLLVYEFMQNGSLDRLLFSDNSMRLSWEDRYRIAVGTAKGIFYLHEECRDCIVHCDIKPENILLDDNYCAKVSDFGLAKLAKLQENRQQTLALVRGTRGYLAPEWLGNTLVSPASDVYSYGMVLLEIVGGRRNFEVLEETGGKVFSDWAFEECCRGNVAGIIDIRLHGSEVDMLQVERAVLASFWCIQEQASLRPSMGKVLQMLEGIVEIQRPPTPKPAADGSSSGGGMRAIESGHLNSSCASRDDVHRSLL